MTRAFAEQLQESLDSSILAGSRVSLPLSIDELSATLRMTSPWPVADPVTLVQLLDDSARFRNALRDASPALALYYSWQVNPATLVFAPLPPSPALPPLPLPSDPLRHAHSQRAFSSGSACAVGRLSSASRAATSRAGKSDSASAVAQRCRSCFCEREARGGDMSDSARCRANSAPR